MDLNHTPESQAREEAKGPIAKTLLYFGYPVNAQNIENSEHCSVTFEAQHKI